MAEAVDHPNPSPAPPAKWPRVIAWTCWMYVLASIALWVLLRTAGDRWWIATLLLFGHRWVWALPLALLVPAAAIWRRKSLWVAALGAAIVLGPINDLCIPWRPLFAKKTTQTHLRILTCNNHGSATDPAKMASLIASANPDLVLMQEWHADRAAVFGQHNWKFLQDGELLIASHFPIRRVKRSLGGRRGSGGVACRYLLDLPSGPVTIYNVHLESPHQAFRAAVHSEPGAAESVEENSQHRLEEALDLAKDAASAGNSVILAGDFNLPCDSRVYRQALAGYSDAFSVAGFGYGWTYRVRGTVTRIDHILAGQAWSIQNARVAPDVGSPHRPLIADLAWIGR